jgi:hypothetical protein
MNRFSTWLIRLLGGEIKVYVPHRVTTYNGLGRPFETSDWERLATMHSWGPEFFRYNAMQLQLLDQSDRLIPVGPEKDRDRLVSAVRRMVLSDYANLSDTAAAEVTKARNRAETRARERGLNNHGA